MDGIQPYSPQSRPPATHAQGYSPPVNPAAIKGASDYFRALRGRFWLVLMVAVPLSVAATVHAVRQPAIYRAEAQIQIVPPQYDQVLSTLVSHDLGRTDKDADAMYLPNRINQLKSVYLLERVLSMPDFLNASNPGDTEAAKELLTLFSVKPLLNSNHVYVTLEGTDPSRTAKLLFAILDRFRRDAQTESKTGLDSSREHANLSLGMLEEERKGVEQRINEMLKESEFIGPGGKNLIQSQLDNLGNVLLQKRFRFDEFRQQSWISEMNPRPSSFGPEDGARSSQIARLEEERQKLTLSLREAKRRARDKRTDPTILSYASRLNGILNQIEKLENARHEVEPVVNPFETISSSMGDEMRATEKATEDLMGKLRESMPDHQKYLALQEERESILKRIYDMKTKLSEFKTLAASQREPVTIPTFVAEPTVPVRPRRSINIALGLIVSFGLGIGLVCLLEYLDHSVKVPDHLTIGLTLPLLGVVPRIRRTALVARGGHLWTPGIPDSLEADAYRNLRASLLGASDRLGPIVTLLVTSAKAGEGKSTTALNLAATCARAGERTLLMDVDLRRPSLAEVFQDDDPSPLGLVDVLRGELPWQRTLVRTDIPNLDFLPTGDTRDVPIEILGTLELRQLLIALASHYDRVILDGPAVLGLADCRMLGRVVDAAILVVRSGSQEMRPLQRAKEMLEQSRVVLAGIVFNGLHDDVQNWSSYGPSGQYDATSYGRTNGGGGSLSGPSHTRAEALPLAGTRDS